MRLLISLWILSSLVNAAATMKYDFPLGNDPDIGTFSLTRSADALRKFNVPVNQTIDLKEVLQGHLISPKRDIHISGSHTWFRRDQKSPNAQAHPQLCVFFDEVSEEDLQTVFGPKYHEMVTKLFHWYEYGNLEIYMTFSLGPTRIPNGARVCLKNEPLLNELAGPESADQLPPAAEPSVLPPPRGTSYDDLE